MTLLAIGFAILLAIAVAGRLLSPEQGDGGPVADDEFSACMACVDYLQEQGELPEGTELPSCLLEVGASYRGEGVYDVRSTYVVPAGPTESTTHEYRCRAQRSEDGNWTILDFRLED